MQKHIRCAEGDVARAVLLPGDPARAERIAEHFEEKRKVAQNREFTIFTGKYQGRDVSVCSTGIGGPSAVIALEELVRVGADTFIRVGSAGARLPHIKIGDLVVITAAIRHDGVSREYLPIEFPAVADFDLTAQLIATARQLYGQCHYGIAYTRDAYYRQDKARNELYSKVRVVASEMECAPLFTAAQVLGVRCAALVGTDSNIWLEHQPSLAEKEALYLEAEQRTIRTALETIGRGDGEEVGTI